jgi:hypothetical protein
VKIYTLLDSLWRQLVIVGVHWQSTVDYSLITVKGLVDVQIFFYLIEMLEERTMLVH